MNVASRGGNGEQNVPAWVRTEKRTTFSIPVDVLYFNFFLLVWLANENSEPEDIIFGGIDVK